MAEIRAKYACTQVELYAIAEMSIKNLETDLAVFAAKKAKYTAAFVTTLKGLRTTAMSLPDEEARNGVHQALKNLLPGLTDPCRDNFNDLKGYIRDAWPSENPVPRYEQAGLVRYNKIGENNWENVAGMNESMTQFVAANTALLTAPGGMVATFAAKVASDSTAFQTTYNSYLNSRETATASAEKVNANNVLYDALMSFMKDGIEMVYRTDEANKKRYVFAVLKDIVSPPGSASLKVTVRDALDIPVTDKEVVIKKEDFPPIMVKTDADGVAFFKSTDAGTYTGTIDNKGTKVTFKKDVNTGVDARVTVVLEN